MLRWEELWRVPRGSEFVWTGYLGQDYGILKQYHLVLYDDVVIKSGNMCSSTFHATKCTTQTISYSYYLAALEELEVLQLAGFLENKI